ncbi:MAG: UDP-N-acetylglucosamine 2-epimerase (non-hydrolyzing) [Candidatus Omnitrophica bacterium CG12_big_fil_rev_8_21_14_0_65_50_5]|nr:MAG: UDP-N-acetylglucosamine 2-epimerase (non-hydrolyzing) [Candidatus Omnitrophica bacterium CG12_big_fil_rev_8_21_14_0_65_50_5]
MKIVSVVGARPNFMKIAPIIRAVTSQPSIEHLLVHTGQHYDEKMSKSFFKDLGIPKPDVNLEAGSGSHARQTAEIMMRFEPVLLKYKPDLMIVVGDVNSTLGCSVVASKLRVAVAHVEAGLRSLDRDMPEEINRLVTDSITDIFFTTSPDADQNLIKEGIAKNRIFFVGNVMIDTLMHNLNKASQSKILHNLHLKPRGYALLTMHRPSNVDDPQILKRLAGALAAINQDIPVVFPVHPRTRNNLKHPALKNLNAQLSRLKLIEPLGYLDFLSLMTNARFVLTDSGGIQEETTVLGIPCLTLRENTERPITVTQGTNVLVGSDPKKILSEVKKILAGRHKKGRRPKYWDGKSARRIVETLMKLKKNNRLLLVPQR